MPANPTGHRRAGRRWRRWCLRRPRLAARSTAPRSRPPATALARLRARRRRSRCRAHPLLRHERGRRPRSADGEDPGPQKSGASTSSMSLPPMGAAIMAPHTRQASTGRSAGWVRLDSPTVRRLRPDRCASGWGRAPTASATRWPPGPGRRGRWTPAGQCAGSGPTPPRWWCRCRSTGRSRTSGRGPATPGTDGAGRRGRVTDVEDRLGQAHGHGGVVGPPPGSSPNGLRRPHVKSSIGVKVPGARNFERGADRVADRQADQRRPPDRARRSTSVGPSPS